MRCPKVQTKSPLNPFKVFFLKTLPFESLHHLYVCVPSSNALLVACNNYLVARLKSHCLLSNSSFHSFSLSLSSVLSLLCSLNCADTLCQGSVIALVKAWNSGTIWNNKQIKGDVRLSYRIYDCKFRILNVAKRCSLFTYSTGT